MNEEHSRLGLESFSHAVTMAGHSVQNAASAYERPHVLMRPYLCIDGNSWCALYGEDLQSGVAGFGNSPAKAMEDFDKNWYKDLDDSE